VYRAVKKKLIYQSPAILQQAKVLLELAFLQNSDVQPAELFPQSKIKAGYSEIGSNEDLNWD